MKATLMDRQGCERGAAVATPFHDGEMTVDELGAAVARLTAALGDARSRVAAVGIAGIAESGAPLDRHGRAQAPIIAWHDPRGAEVVERLRRRLGPELERSIGQRLRTVSSVAKLGWLVDHGVGPVDRWFGVPELALLALTGREATEFSLAARTGAYHVGERRYLPEVAEALGVAAHVFLPPEPAGRPMGWVSAGGGAWSGLPEGIPVTIAGHDHLAGRFGAGARPEDVANSVGTAETVVASSAALPDLDAALALRVAVTVMPGGKGWALLASAARAGIVLSAVAQALARPVGAMDLESVGAGRATVGDEVIEAAAHGDPFELPAGSPGALWNGVLDALVARAWEAVDRLGQVAEGSGPTPVGAGRAAGDAGGGVAGGGLVVFGGGSGSGAEAVGRERVAGGAVGGGGLVVFGGGSRSGPWLAAKAQARPGTPVWRSAATEAVARGAALFAGVAAGWWPEPDAGPEALREPVIAG
jgi:xylulokinase